MILFGLAAEPALWQLAAPSGQGRAVTVPGLQMVRAAAGPWAVAVPGRAEVPGLALDAPQAERVALAHLLTGLGLRAEGDHWLGLGGDAAPEPMPEIMTVILALARDILALQGRAAPEDIARRLGPMLVRAASRLRAQVQAAPPGPRLSGRVAAQAWRQPYAHFFAIEEHDLSWQRFDGSMSGVATRAAFLSGDAVTVLPYDPKRDRVLVIEQFRVGPYVRGDGALWQIEAIAGRVDPFETPEEAARREAVEEAGLALRDLEFVARYYPSPGALSEYIYSYVALTDLPDDAAGVFGLAEEAEDIRGHLLDFDAFMELVAAGAVDNAPLTLTALWLQRERPRLRLPK